MKQPNKANSRVRSLDNPKDTTSIKPAERGQLMSDRGVKMFKAGATREQVAAFDAKNDAKARKIVSTGTETRGSSQNLPSKRKYTPVSTEYFDKRGNLVRK
jgi:hypothetical protein